MTLSEFSDGASLPVETVEDVLTDTSLVVPDLRLASPLLVHRTLLAAASEVVVDGWNFRTERERETDPFLDAIVVRGGRDSGLARFEVVDPADPVGTCPTELEQCTVVRVGGVQVRSGIERAGLRPGWLRVEADRHGHRIRVLLQPQGKGQWSLPEELAQRAVVSAMWDQIA